MTYAENHENMPCKRCGVIHPYLTKFCVPIEHDQVLEFTGVHKGTTATCGELFPDFKWVAV